jgi:hypothetical protein
MTPSGRARGPASGWTETSNPSARHDESGQKLVALEKMRAAQRVRDDGGTEVLVRDEPCGSWRAWLGADTSYGLSVEAFSEDGGICGTPCEPGGSGQG